MQKFRVLAPTIILGTLLLTLGWTLVNSNSYQTCVENEQHQEPPDSKNRSDALLHRSAINYWCAGDFIEANNAVITTLATVVIAAFTFTLWRATTEQGRLTKQALVADKRAFVFAIKLAPEWERDAFFVRNYNWRLRTVWTNSGDTTTKQLRLYSDCIVRDEPLFDDAFFIEHYGVGTGFLGPKATMAGGAAPLTWIDRPQPPITPYDVYETIRGRRFIYLWGWVKYFDVFEGTPERTTRFCWQILPNGNPFNFVPGNTPSSLTWNYIQLDYGNCADEECERRRPPTT